MDITALGAVVNRSLEDFRQESTKCIHTTRPTNSRHQAAITDVAQHVHADNAWHPSMVSIVQSSLDTDAQFSAFDGPQAAIRIKPGCGPGHENCREESGDGE